VEICSVKFVDTLVTIIIVRPSDLWEFDLVSVSLSCVYRCYFIAQSYLSVKKYKEVLALYERTLDYAQQSLEAHHHNQHDQRSKASSKALHRVAEFSDPLHHFGVVMAFR